jgi:hypothetical protein
LLVACCVEKREMIFLAFGEKTNSCTSHHTRNPHPSLDTSRYHSTTIIWSNKKDSMMIRFGVTVLVAITSLTVVHAYSILKEGMMISRRNVFASSASVAAAGFSSSLLIDLSSIAPANAADTVVSPLNLYKDETCNFSIDVPSDWIKNENTLPDRRKIVLYFKPDSDQKTLMFIAYTPVRNDFTTLGSFGSVDDVGQSTILPKSELAGNDGVDATMLSAVVKKQGN